MKKATLPRLLALYFFICITVNLVHPVTPSLFQELGFPDYMFGAAYAAMALLNFAFCPLWGVLCDRVGYVKCFSVSIAGYGLGQIIFLCSGTVPMTLFARAVTGSFSGGFAIASMSYTAQLANTDTSRRGKYVAYYTAIQSVGTAMGFFLGGMVGVNDPRDTFWLQIAMSFAMAVLILVSLKEIAPVRAEKSRLTLREVNPVSAFIDVRRVLTPALAVFLLAAALTGFGGVCFDNSFNYYIRDQLHFPTSYNGIIKAVVGLLGLLVNFTLNMLIASRAYGRRAIIPVLIGAGATLIAVPFITNIPLFIAVSILFFIFNVMYLPIQQSLVAHGDASGVLYGAYNATRSLGMVVGSLFAGFAYGTSPQLPFFGAGAVFFLAAVLFAVNVRQYKKLGES